jgi:hypothetical protein
MFSSISRAIPNSQVTTQFTATQSISLATSDAIDFQIGGVSYGTTVVVNAGDTVVASVTAPVDFLYHTFFNYTIDGVPQVFAVANKKAFTFHVIDPKKQWYNYFPLDHTLSFQNAAGKTKPLIFANQAGALQSDSHVVMDGITSSVYFYTDKQVLLSKVELPAAPIDYVQVPDKDAVVVLCFGGEVYEVLLNSSTNQLPSLKAIKNYSEYSGDITYVNRLPGEDIISYLRRIRSKKAIPAGTCLSYDGTFVWAGGNGTVWLIDPNNLYQLVNSFAFTEYAFGIAAFPDSSAAIVTTQSNKIILVTNAGVFTELYQGIALGQPARLGSKIYIPEGETGEILIYNTATDSFEASFPILDFSPSYTRVKDNQLYICGNDSEIVLVYDANMRKVKTLTFTSKVTWVSVYKNTVIASHWLKDFKLLLTTDLYRVVPVEFTPMTGPVSHVGSNLVTARMLGETTVSSFTPPGVTLWINGIRSNSRGTVGALLNDGDMFSISYAAQVAGVQKVSCVVGDSAFDFVVNAVAQTYFPRYIDFTIKLPDIDGRYSENFLMPPNMKPCLMSIEYGTLLLNGLPYNGTANVTPSSTITITVEAGINTIVGAGLAPIFTLGQRQFAVPISLNPALSTPTIVFQGGLQPSTPVEQSSIVNGSAVLYNVIIPNYYSVLVKKNGLLVTGDYYVQFSQSDLLTVNFVSSYKRFDTEVVYVLGSDIFKFIAENEIPTGINFLSYPAIIDPYVRFIEPTVTGAAEKITGGTSAFSTFAPPLVEAPIKQYVTGNLQVAGILGSTIANLSISGGDSYFIIDGNLTTDFFANVKQGTNIALARTIQSYFDSNVIITQQYYDIEDDYVSVVVGEWGLINQTMTGVNFYHEGISVSETMSSCELDRDRYNMLPLQATLNRESVIVVNDSRYGFDKNNKTTTGINQVDHYYNNDQTYQASLVQYDNANVKTHLASRATLEISPAIPVWSSIQQLDPSSSTLYPASQVEFVAASSSLIPASQVEFTNQTQLLIAASVLEFTRYPISVADSSKARFMQASAETIQASKSRLMQYNSSNIDASKARLMQYNSSNIDASKSRLMQYNSSNIDASKSKFTQVNLQFSAASKSRFTQVNLQFSAAAKGSWLQTTVKPLAASKNGMMSYNYSFSPVSRSDILHTNMSKDTTAGPNKTEISFMETSAAPGSILYKNFLQVGTALGTITELNSTADSTPWAANQFAESKASLVPPASYQPTNKYFVDTVPESNQVSYADGRGQGAEALVLAGGISKLSVPNATVVGYAQALPSYPHATVISYAQSLPSYPHVTEFLSDKIPTKIHYVYNNVSDTVANWHWETPGAGTAINVKEIFSTDFNRNSATDKFEFVPREMNYWTADTPVSPESSPNANMVALRRYSAKRPASPS